MPSYSPADRDRIVQMVFYRRAAGETLESICSTPGLPSRPTLRKWARESPGFAARLSGGRYVYVTGPRFPFNPDAAERFLLRVRLGDPVSALIRRPDMPQRRELNAWKRQDPAFAARLEDAKALADHDRRRYGRRLGGYRRSRMRYDEAVAGRIILAAIRGATLLELARDPTFPTKLGLRRWRKAHPDFDGALRTALRGGGRARGEIRADRFYAPQLREKILHVVAQGASLHSLAKQPGMPSLYTLYKWVRERPDFAADIARACDRRAFRMADEAIMLLDEHGLAAVGEINAIQKRLGQLNPYPGEKRRGGRCGATPSTGRPSSPTA